jgi:hypothetical protein
MQFLRLFCVPFCNGSGCRTREPRCGQMAECLTLRRHGTLRRKPSILGLRYEKESFPRRGARRGDQHFTGGVRWRLTIPATSYRGGSSLGTCASGECRFLEVQAVATRARSVRQRHKGRAGAGCPRALAASQPHPVMPTTAYRRPEQAESPAANACGRAFI